jgi:hypothetical protein
MKYRWAATGAIAFAMAGCSSLPPEHKEAAHAPAVLRVNPWTAQTGAPQVQASLAGEAIPVWEHMTFPGKTATRFSYARKDGRDAVAVLAASSVSALRHRMRVEPQQLSRIRFSWQVPQLIAGADMASRDADDSPVRVVLYFEGDRSKFSPKDAMLSELVRALGGEEMPYATLMYVWCNKREPGSVIANPRTGRIRTLVVESGSKNLGQWLDYERDIRADYERAFGEPPGALLGIGIMSDSDNTRTTTQAWYGPVKLQPR